MKTFVVAYLNFFDNDLKVEKVKANTEVEAIKKYLGGEWVFPEGATLNDIQDICFNADTCINAIEV